MVHYDENRSKYDKPQAPNMAKNPIDGSLGHIKKGEIRTRIEDLINTVVRLDTLTQTLCESLSPVTRQEPSKTSAMMEKDGLRAEPNTEFGSMLTATNERLCAIIQRLGDVYSLLEV